MDESDWKWVEGIVDTNEDHIKIRYGDDPEPIALVAPGPEKTFIVQFVMEQKLLFHKDEEVLDDVRKELDFFLVELGEEDPWGYYPKGYEGR